MSEIISRCGFRCDLCMAYRENGKGWLHQLKTAEGWFKYYDYMVHPSKIVCDGCLKGESRIFRFHDSFENVCDCVTSRKIDNCSLCGDYPCSALESLMTVCEDVKKRYSGRISMEEYSKFIAPYDPRIVLEELRNRKDL